MESISYQKKNNYQLIMLVLLSITIGSCYSIETDCVGIPIDPGPLPPILPAEGFWEPIVASPFMVYVMACDANGNLWAVDASFSNVLYLYNGNSWQLISQLEEMVYAIAVAPNGDIYIVKNSSLQKSTNGGSSWNTVFNFNAIEKNKLAEIVISHSGDVYFATYNNVYVPNGNSWKRATNNELPGTFSSPIALSPNGALYAVYKRTYSDEYYIVRSTDAGNSWFRSTTIFNDILNRLTVVDNNTIFVATGSNGILKSTDGSRSWNRCDPIIPGRITSAYDIIYNYKTRTLFADIDGYPFSTCNAFISTDLGESWEVQNDILGDEPLRLLGPYCFAYNPITGDTYLRGGIGYLVGVTDSINFGPVYRYVQYP
jgi:photosystem II stability/assembly factor-like uncharacterized protein